MRFLEIAPKNKIRRNKWPEYDYIELKNMNQSTTGTVMYWNNALFKWFEIRLSLQDLVALDWVEA